MIKDDDYYYEGQIQNGKINGIGRKVSSQIEEGFFRGGELNGFGRVVYNDSSWYEGLLSDGQKNGKGKLTFPDGTSKTQVWIPQGEICKYAFSPIQRSSAPKIPILRFSNSTLPYVFDLDATQYFVNKDPKNCKFDNCLILDKGCSKAYNGSLYFDDKTYKISTLRNNESGSSESFCFACDYNGKQ